MLVQGWFLNFSVITFETGWYLDLGPSRSNEAHFQP
jgi:hypothetical protein